jgi:hypothetical protein
MKSTALMAVIASLCSLTGCTSGGGDLRAAGSERSSARIAPLLDGLGDHHHPITTDVALAQRYFDQGLILAFGFDHAEAAERAYREDLDKYLENGWSLFGLQQALDAQGRVEEAADLHRRFEKAWARADFNLEASRF